MKKQLSLLDEISIKKIVILLYVLPDFNYYQKPTDKQIALEYK